jgi:hypothetical protein
MVLVRRPLWPSPRPSRSSPHAVPSIWHRSEPRACVLNGGPDDDDFASADATTEPAVRLAALLRALAVEAGRG